MENTETQVWLDFSFAFKYLEEGIYEDLTLQSEEIGKMIHHIIKNPESYLSKSDKIKT